MSREKVSHLLDENRLGRLEASGAALYLQ